MRGVTRTKQQLLSEAGRRRLAGLGQSAAGREDKTKPRKQTAAQRESEDRYRALMDQAAEAIVIADLDGTLIEINRKAEELFGYTRKELAGRPFTVLHPTDEHEEALSAFASAAQGFSLTATALRKDGTEISVDIACSHVTFGNQTVSQAIFRNAADRRQLVEALARAERECRQLFESVPVGICRSSPDGRFLAANPFTARIMGFDSPEQMMQSVKDIGTQIYRNPEDRRRVLAILREQGYARDYEAEYATKTGASGWGIVNAKAVRDGEGNVLYYEGVVQDITDRKRAEAELIRSRNEMEERVAERTRALVDMNRALSEQIEERRRLEERWNKTEFITNSAEELMTLVNPQYVYEAVNDAYCRAHSIPRDLVIGRTMADIWGARTFADFVKPRVDRCLKAEVVRDEGWVDFPTLGHRYITMAFYPYPRDAAEPTHVAVVTHDITDRKTTEQYLKVREEDLKVRAKELEEANTALKVFFNRQAEDRRKLEDNFVFNVNELVLPYVSKMQQHNLGKQCRTYLAQIEQNLQQIVSPFMKNLATAYRKLTHQEIRIAEMVRQGKSTEEMASIMNVAVGTVKTHRNNLRKKLNLRNNRANLRSYLLTLS
jgi:PAS domain S-box-containing protein